MTYVSHKHQAENPMGSEQGILRLCPEELFERLVHSFLHPNSKQSASTKFRQAAHRTAVSPHLKLKQTAQTFLDQSLSCCAVHKT